MRLLCDYLAIIWMRLFGQKMRLFEKGTKRSKLHGEKNAIIWMRLSMRLFGDYLNMQILRKTCLVSVGLDWGQKVNLGCGHHPAKPCGHP